MSKALLAKFKTLSPAHRIELVYELWDSISSEKSSSLNDDLLNLTSLERIELAQDLWDSVAPEDMPPLTQEQIEECERRLAEHHANPGSAVPWEEVWTRLRARFG